MPKKRPAKANSSEGNGSVRKDDVSRELSAGESAEPSVGQPTAVAEDRSDAAGPARDSDECVVVGIGASAGGLDAFKRILHRIPDDTGMAFVLVQHLDPTHESLMAELLSKYTSMPVLQVSDAMAIQPNHVYMIPPNKFITVVEGGLFLERPISRRGVRLPIDHFFHSLAESRKERAICVVLSGTGSDGAEGLRQVRNEGGMTIAQNPETAEYDGMPRAAIASGSVDFILSIEDMAGVIVPYAKHPYARARSGATIAETAPDHYRSILSLLRAHTDQDFSHYRKGTLTRRIERRMGIKQLDDAGDYLKLLRDDTSELRALFRDLLIGVTRFFRNEEAWDELADILTRHVRDDRASDPVRIWVPGCSSGEEAYTIAMMLLDQQERQKLTFDFQIFGTDIDSAAIATARTGAYADGCAKGMTDDFVKKYFTREGDRIRVHKKLREKCVFAVQNCLSDPPFSSLDLVSCRNLLIYLETEIQQRVFDMFHFALKPDGLLFLGSSESPGRRKHLFETLSHKSRVYRKLGENKTGPAELPVDSRPTFMQRRPATAPKAPESRLGGTVELARRTLLDEFAPASVVVDQQGRIQFLHGPVRDYLDFPSGEPDLDLSAMVVNGLKAKVRTAMQRARVESEVVTLVAPRVRREGGFVPVRLRVQPLSSAKGREAMYLVSFWDDTPDERSEAATELAGQDDDLPPGDHDKMSWSERQLVLELQATREDLQSTIEQLESSNEELKASSEEVMSMNEELQSTNEELETSREELQSLNEELTTVNNQLHDKVEELESANNDLTNLLASTDTATLFLDQELRIRRYTPATVRLMNLIETDIGRPLSDLAPRVNDPDLESDGREVLRQLTPAESEVQNNDGHWFMRRITPFRTSENKIEGVVVTFADVTTLKDSVRRLELRERQQAAVAQLGRAALANEDLPSLLDHAVDAVSRTLGVNLVKLLKLTPDRRKFQLLSGVGWKEGLVGRTTVPNGITSQAGFTLQSAGPVIVKDLRKEKRFDGPALLTDHDVVAGISVIVGPEETPWGVLGAHATREIAFTVDDANFLQAMANVLWEAIDRDARQRTLAMQLAEIQTTYRGSPIGLGFVDTDLRFVRVNDALAAISGVPPQQHRGRSVRELLPDLADRIEPVFRETIESGRSRKEVELSSATGDGAEDARHWLMNCSPLIIDDEVRGVNATLVEITVRKAAEASLVASQSRLSNLIETASVGIAFAKADGTVLQANDAMLQIFGIDREVFDRDGWDWQDRVLPNDQRFADCMRQLWQNNDIIEPIELARQDADGDVVWVLASARTLEGEPDEYVAFLVDITDQKKAEFALAESEERLRFAARTAGFGTYFCNAESGEVVWSPELKHIFGLDAEDPVPVSVGQVPDYVHPDDRDRVKRKVEASLDPSGNGTFEDEHRILRPDGEIRWLLIKGTTEFHGKGDGRRAARLAGVALDITERHVYEQKLESARQDADRANAAKSQFLANMSHEIRTPMAAILGYAEVLEPLLSDDDAENCLRIIRENGEFLCEIIDDILDLAKIEVGKFSVDSDSCDLLEIIAHVRSLLTVRAGEKELTLNVDFTSRIPNAVQSDGRFVRQVLINLVGNAIKFTEQGEVKIVASCDPDDELICIDVIDTGVGIEAAELDRLFEPFEQGDNSHTRKVGGTGLGLSISRTIAKALGGDISASSRIGEGSTFRFTFATGPLETVEWVTPDPATLRTERDQAEPADLPEISGRVMVVDDRRDIRFLVERFVGSAGGETVTAENGEEAVKLWKKLQSLDAEPDIILMDMQMPVVDGVAATSRLRDLGCKKPIITLTANVLNSDRRACLDAGSNDFVSKPIDRAELINKLDRWLTPN